jgi:hypothetical protein
MEIGSQPISNETALNCAMANALHGNALNGECAEINCISPIEFWVARLYRVEPLLNSRDLR